MFEIKMNKIEKKEWLGWVFEWISNGLKELMDKITGWINDVLVKLWLKKETEKKETEEETINKLEETEKKIRWDITKKELKNLMEEIENDWKLTEEEENVVEKIKNKEIKNYIDRLEETFESEDIQEREKEIILNELEAITTWDSDQTLGEFKNKLSQQQEQINEDENLKWIIEDINKDKEDYLIQDILVAYNKTKEKRENGLKIILNKDSVLDTLKN